MAPIADGGGLQFKYFDATVFHCKFLCHGRMWTPDGRWQHLDRYNSHYWRHHISFSRIITLDLDTSQTLISIILDSIIVNIIITSSVTFGDDKNVNFTRQVLPGEDNCEDVWITVAVVTWYSADTLLRSLVRHLVLVAAVVGTDTVIFRYHPRHI